MSSRTKQQIEPRTSNYDYLLWQLLRSKRDILHYSILLKEIYTQTTAIKCKRQAGSLIQQQLKANKILDDTLDRLSSNRYQLQGELVEQFEKEIDIFDEIHFRLKKRYYDFINQWGLPQPTGEELIVA